MKPKYKAIFAILALIVILYHYVAFVAWQLRNPHANQATVWSHYGYAITFQKLPEFSSDDCLQWKNSAMTYYLAYHKAIGEKNEERERESTWSEWQKPFISPPGTLTWGKWCQWRTNTDGRHEMRVCE